MKCLNPAGIAALAGFGLLAFSSASVTAAEKPVPGNTAYISTADNQWMLTLPMDSRASVEMAFTVMNRDFGVDRVFWRGAQDEFWFHSFTFREDNRFFFELWAWFRHLIEDVGTNQAAMESARRHGMEIWMDTGLFEFGTQADAGMYPYSFEDSPRIQHPEWIPVNKYGTRRQGGPIEFAYPEARRFYVERLANYLKEHKYDGVVFYTYVENFTSRYSEEFGYNQPIVDEFKKRYGVDIRQEPFDKDARAKLRGEYVTAFLRELHAELAPHGIEIAMRLSPVEDSHLPEIWAASGDKPFRTMGHVYLDWETWAKEGIVSELCIYWPGNEKILKDVLEGVKGTDARVSMYQTLGEMVPGVVRCIAPGEEVETGFPRESYAGWDHEVLAPQSLDALDGTDQLAKRRVLYMISRGKQPDADQSFEKVARAVTEDPDLYVRRRAVEALVVLGDPRAVPVLEAALNDAENSVRCKAAVALGKLGNSQSVEKLFEAVRKTNTLQFTHVAAKGAIIALAGDDLSVVIRHTKDDDVNVRRLAVQCLVNRDTPESRAALIDSAANDADAYVRELAIGSIATLKADEQTIGALISAMSDEDEVVQIRTSTYLATCIPQAAALESAVSSENQWRLDQPIRFAMFDADTPQGKTQRDVMHRLLALFRSFGDGCTRGDADWGWRLVGNAILCFGDEGEAELKKLIRQKEDRTLAELAWQVVYIRQQPLNYCFSDEKQDREAHSHHPFPTWKN